MSDAIVNVDRDIPETMLAKARPGLFVRTFLDELQAKGQAVLVRLFTIATDEDVQPKVQLQAIDMILKISNAADVLAVAMGLKQQKGRPGEDSDAEAQQAREEWGNVVQMHENPPGSGEYEQA